MARQLAGLGRELVLTARRVDRLEERQTACAAIVSAIEAGKTPVFAHGSRGRRSKAAARTAEQPTGVPRAP